MTIALEYFGVRWSVVVTLFLVITWSSVLLGKKCPGKCVPSVTECKLGGGKVAGFCTNELACCDYASKKIGTCGSKMVNLTTALFRSPDFPDMSHGDLICQFDFEISPLANGLIVDFVEMIMDGRGFTPQSECESDQIFLKGFPNWTPPPQCGNMTKYAAVIDLKNDRTRGMTTLRVLALMSSDKYRWNIKITQVFPSAREKFTEKAQRKPKPTRIPLPDDNSAEGEDSDSDSDLVMIEDVEDEDNDKENDNLLESEDEDEVEELASLMSILEKRKLNVGQRKQQHQQRPQHIVVDGNDNLMISSAEDGDNGLEYGDSDPMEETFIVNGEDTKITSVPWQASLRNLITTRTIKLLPQLGLKNCTVSEGVHFCGGTIISDRHILSATHCFLLGEKLATWQKLTRIKVVVGDSNLCDGENEEDTYFEDGHIQEFRVDKVFYHYAHDIKAVLNDLVVIRLHDKIKFNENIQAIRMADSGMNFQNMEATASGWGFTNLTMDEGKKKSPEQLQIATGMYIANETVCTKESMKQFQETRPSSLKRYPKWADMFKATLCTYVKNGTTPLLVGQGDSGGPLIIPKYAPNSSELATTPEPILIGVISYMLPISTSDPHDVSNYVDFYQSVAFYRNWIDVAMQ